MLTISAEGLRQGTERASDLFKLSRLRSSEEGAAGLDALWQAFGIDEDARRDLLSCFSGITPVSGMPEIELGMRWGLTAGVLVGLLIADSASPLDPLDELQLPA